MSEPQTSWDLKWVRGGFNWSAFRCSLVCSFTTLTVWAWHGTKLGQWWGSWKLLKSECELHFLKIQCSSCLKEISPLRTRTVSSLNSLDIKQDEDSAIFWMKICMKNWNTKGSEVSLRRVIKLISSGLCGCEQMFLIDISLTLLLVSCTCKTTWIWL